MSNPGDVIQITYYKELVPVIEVIQSPYIREDREWLYLETGRYRISKIKAYRNITKDKAPPVIEPE